MYSKNEAILDFKLKVTKRVKKIMLNTTSIRRMRVVFDLIFFTSFVTYL